MILFYPIFQPKSSRWHKKIERSWVHNFSLGDLKNFFDSMRRYKMTFFMSMYILASSLFLLIEWVP